MFDPAYISWMSDEEAANLCLGSEKKKQEFLRQQREAGKKASEAWFQEKLQKTRGKDISQIPRDGYCQDSWIPEQIRAEYEACVEECGELSEQAFLMYSKHAKDRRCPYQEYTGHGTVICHFLEEEAIGFNEGDFEKASRHFGSDDEAERRCAGSTILYDAVSCCECVLKAIEDEKDKRG